MKKKKIIVAISGASGVIYGIELLRLLKISGQAETHLILSDTGLKNIEIETELCPQEVEKMADFVYDNSNLAAPVSSGSFEMDAMVVIPCTIKSLSMIANSINSNLLVRAADVTLKEKRKLVLVVRETPFHLGHLRLMTQAAEIGAHILPPIPSFYHKPKTIEDIIHQSIGKIFDYLKIEHNLFQRWEGQ